ncbi:elongator protein 3 [Fragilaria crotonensis]|nr:elongator protein 3 [Fragilaria crotonensis]
MDARYRNALLQEIDSLNNKDIDDENDNRTLSSIYFGGGTPSLAPLETIQAILDAIRRRFHVDKDTVEITMEMDPGTFDEVQLRHLADIGVNRISLGVQALDDAVLEQIGRVHRVQDIHESIRMIRRVFVGDNNNHNDDHEAPNFSIDLISGLPGVSLSAWANALEMAVYDLKPSHISIYDLQIEKGTVFGRWYDDEASIVKSTSPPRTKGRSFLPSPDDCAYMYRYASGYLRNEGFEHYEISSYARAGKRSRHNQVYWGYQTEWFAIGLGSTSYLNHHRCARPRAMSDYLEWVKQQSSEPEWLRVANNDPAIPASRDPERLADIVLTRLRTIDGLDLDWLQCAYGESVVDAVLKGAQLALDLGLANINNRILSLNDPKGFLFSNSILSNIFVELPDTPG